MTPVRPPGLTASDAFERVAADPEARWCPGCSRDTNGDPDRALATSGSVRHDFTCLLCDTLTVSMREPWHGTAAGGRHHRCQCPPCRGWSRDDKRSRTMRKEAA